MRNKDIIRLLQTIDEDSAVQLGTEYRGIAKEDHARLLQKVQQKLERPEILSAGEAVLHRNRCAWFSHTAAGAACILIFGGTFAGLFWMNTHAPDDPHQNTSYTIGECCPAAHLTSSGTLWLTVEHAGFLEDGRYQVTLTVESDAAAAPDGSQVFLADNFLLAYDAKDGMWDTVSPCSISDTGEAYPYAYTLADGQTRTLTLTYQTEETPAAFVTSRSAGSSYIALTEE